MSTTHYEILCVDAEADEATIRAAYRRLVKIYHPDVAGAKGMVMAQKLNEAMDVLTNSVSRAEYDRKISVTTESRPTAKTKRSKPAPAPAPEPIPDADVWRPEQVDVSEAKRPHVQSLRWLYYAGFACWALFWVITLLRPGTEPVGFFQWAYPIVAGGLTVLSIGRGLLSVRTWVNFAVIALGPLWFLSHAPLNLHLPVMEILGGIGERALYAESVFALGTALIGRAFSHEVSWDLAVLDSAKWTAFMDEASVAPRSMWLVNVARNNGGFTTVDAVNDATGRRDKSLKLSGACDVGQYILVDEYRNVTATALTRTRAAYRRLVAAS